jgi:FlaA1/EpsC-like NDP-sugar epimerase
LARRMIELSGLTVRDDVNPDGDILIEIKGLRPGEKLFEELMIGDNPLQTSHPSIMRAQDDFILWNDLLRSLNELDCLLQNKENMCAVRELIKKLVPDYKPTHGILDWLNLEKKV